MATINIEHDYFSCHQSEEMAVIRVNRGAKKIFTSVGEKENLIAAVETIKATEGINGVAIIYSDKYAGNEQYRQLLRESLQDQVVATQGRTITYRSAIRQILKAVYRLPMPIVSGLNGEIGPDSFGLNLAFDLRIAADRLLFFNHNLELGFPPSAVLSFFLAQSLGSPLATELMLTRTELRPEEMLDLRLVSKIVPAEELETACLTELRKLTAIPGHAFVEARNMLQPNLDNALKHIDEGFEGSLRCLFKMKD